MVVKNVWIPGENQCNGMMIEAPSNRWNTKSSTTTVRSKSLEYYMTQIKARRVWCALPKVSDIDLRSICLCVMYWYWYTLMLFAWSRTCVCIENSIWDVCALWFRNLVFHLICMRIHNKIIRFSVRSDSVKGGLCGIVAVIVSPDLFSWANIHSSNNNSCWYFHFGFCNNNNKRDEREKETKKYVHPGCFYQQIHYNTILLSNFMLSSCYLTRIAADIDLGASMKCWMFYAIEIAHQKIILSQLLCYLNKMCLLCCRLLLYFYVCWFVCNLSEKYSFVFFSIRLYLYWQQLKCEYSFKTYFCMYYKHFHFIFIISVLFCI